jgi:hypothetical protein
MSMKDPHAAMRRKWAATHAARLAEGESLGEAIDEAVRAEGEPDTTSDDNDGSDDGSDDGFRLMTSPAVVAARPQPAKFENVKTRQKPLFVGAMDEPGQSYLFGTGVEAGYQDRARKDVSE